MIKITKRLCITVNVVKNILVKFYISFFKASKNGYSNIVKILNKTVNSTKNTVNSKINTKTFLNTSLNNCPSGWTAYLGNCYKIFNTSMSFANAMNYCPMKNQTSFLTQIDSQDEFDWLKKFVSANSDNHVWV